MHFSKRASILLIQYVIDQFKHCLAVIDVMKMSVPASTGSLTEV